MAEENKKVDTNEEAKNQEAAAPEDKKQKLIDKIPKPVKTVAKIVAGTAVAGAAMFSAYVFGRAAGHNDHREESEPAQTENNSEE